MTPWLIVLSFIVGVLLAGVWTLLVLLLDQNRQVSKLIAHARDTSKMLDDHQRRLVMLEPCVLGHGAELAAHLRRLESLDRDMDAALGMSQEALAAQHAIQADLRTLRDQLRSERVPGGGLC